MTTVLGIDLGTQHLKVVFLDTASGDIVASAQAPLELTQGADGTAEQQAHWWTEALGVALAQIDTRIRSSAVAIGVSGQQHGFVPLDAAGNVLAPVKLWCDTSTAPEAAALNAAFGGEARCIEELGNPILPGYTASKVRWFKENQLALYERMATILLPHDYLNFYLTGERCMEAGDASGTGFFDVRARAWSRRMLQVIDPERDLAACLPAVAIDNEVIGKLLPKVASALGLPVGISVSIGGGDNMMGAIGTGNVRPGTVTMSLGTSGTVYAYAENPIVDPKGNIAAFCSSTGGWLPLLCTMNCTVSTELFRGLLGVDIGAFEALVSVAPCGSDGLITVPFFNGERTPNLPNAKGIIVGIDSHNLVAGNLLRSQVEGATFALRFGIDELAALGRPAEEIVLTGGGARSATWRQIVADVCGVPVVVPASDEGAALGAALQAMALIDGERDLAALVEVFVRRDDSQGCMPNTAGVRDYSDVYQSYQRAVAQAIALYGDH
ncbi:MAG: xylulokinase [Pseudomonadota bacterium]